MSETMVVDVSQDWAVACDVQQRFMQSTVLATGSLNYSYSARCRQLRALGGDCYDFLPLAHNRLALAIGDASGKSLPAALMIANVQSSLRTAAHFAGDDPTTVLGAVNRQLHTASLADRFATLFYGVFDPVTRTLSYANAGHNPPVIIRRDGWHTLLHKGGLPLGLFMDSSYEQGAVHLCPGDMLIAYTDGVVEAVGASGEEWGVEGLHHAALAMQGRDCDSSQLVEAVFAALDEFSAGRLADDATVLALLVK